MMIGSNITDIYISNFVCTGFIFLTFFGDFSLRCCLLIFIFISNCVPRIHIHIYLSIPGGGGGFFLLSYQKNQNSHVFLFLSQTVSVSFSFLMCLYFSLLFKFSSLPFIDLNTIGHVLHSRIELYEKHIYEISVWNAIVHINI